MNFKDMLDKISQLSEAETKETEKGRVHKGDYGRHFDTDEEGDEKKKAKADAPKRGRGRPKKDSDDSGEVKKYDTKSLHDVLDRKSTRLNSSHIPLSRMPSSA